MSKVLYSNISRDRKEEFQVCTSIVEENGQKYVLKTAGSSKAHKHIRLMEENYKILKNIYGDSVNIASCTLPDDRTAKFEYIEGKTLTEKIVELYRSKEAVKAIGLISRMFEIIESKSSAIFKPDNKFKEIFGDFNYSKPLKGVCNANYDMVFNNIILDQNEKFNFIDYEWVFDFLLPVNFIFYRSIVLLILTDVFSKDFIKNLLNMFGIDEEQILIYDKLEMSFLRYVRPVSKLFTLYDYHCKLEKAFINHNLNWLDINNPKVFPDYGEGYSELTKKVCSDFDFRNGILNTRVIFDKAPERIRFDPVDGLYCAVSHIKITADDKELEIASHNGSDMFGTLLFDTIDSNIYFENPNKSRQFIINAKIFGFNDEVLLNSLKNAQRLKLDFTDLQNRHEDLQNKYEANNEQIAALQSDFTDLQNRYEDLQNRHEEKNEQVAALQLDLTDLQNRYEAKNEQIAALQKEIEVLTFQKAKTENDAIRWRNSYDIINNSGFWKLTLPARKILDFFKSIFKRKH